ncbi:MAG: efflux RND transporter periplasmic adaptor subunit [Acidobacteriota bacterium]
MSANRIPTPADKIQDSGEPKLEASNRKDEEQIAGGGEPLNIGGSPADPENSLSRKRWNLMYLLMLMLALGGWVSSAYFYCSMPKLTESAQGIAQAQANEEPSEGSRSSSVGRSDIPSESSAPQSSPDSSAGNTIYISSQRQQLIGVQTVAAESKQLMKEIRIVGKVAYDETKLTQVHTKVTGFLEDVFVNYVGQVVKRSEPLFTIYSPDLVATQQEYLLALTYRRQLSKSSFKEVSEGASSLVEAARRRLRLWDVTDEQIERLEREGVAQRTLTIYSPVSGVVTERAAYRRGKYVSPEMDLYTIIDISTVWIMGEVYEYEIPFLKVGQTAEVELPYTPERKKLIGGKITYVYPFLDAKTRTGKIRIECPNPDYQFKPDMFVNMKVSINLGFHIVVPLDAVMNTGTEQYVFVDKGEGYFEPRAVKIGSEAGGLYSIESGLSAGERVVTAANFIIDSESRLKGALANMGKPTEAAKQQAAAAAKLKIDIVEPKTAKVGKNPVRLIVKDPAGNPITEAEVEVKLFMPQMGSMPPMTSLAKLNHEGNGEYTGEIDIPMAWTWETTVTVRKEGQTLGSIQTNITAR